MYGYIYIHIENYNEQFIFSTSISYHFYKGFGVEKVFWGNLSSTSGPAQIRGRETRHRTLLM